MQGGPIDPRWRLVTLKSAVQPPMRYKSTAVSMPELGRIYMFGGLGAKPSNDLWVLDLESREWTQVRADGMRPTPRLYHTMTCDEDASFFVFAGQADSIEHPMAPKSDAEGRELRYRAFQKRPLLGDVWQFDTRQGRWAFHQCPGKQPPPRRGHTCVMLADRAKSGEAALQRQGSTMIDPMIPVTPIRELLVIGGAIENRKGHEAATGELWSLDLDKMTWSHLNASGAFQGRWDHTCTRVGRRLFVIGGLTTTSADYVDFELQRHWGEVQSQIMSLDIDTLVWTRLVTSPFGDVPTLALHGHSAVSDPTEGGEACILVFGGRASDSWTGDVLKYHTLNNAWTIVPVTSTTMPPPRHGHICVTYKHEKKLGVPSLSMRTTMRGKTTIRRHQTLALSLALPPTKPLLSSPCLVLFGGSLLDGGPSYDSGHLFSLEWAPQDPEGGPEIDSPRGVTGPAHVHMGRSVADGSTLPSLMEGRPHTAPSFLSRSASTARSSQRLSVREPVPWEYPQVKAMIRRQQAAGHGHSRATQATKSTLDGSARKPVTAPAKLQGQGQGQGQGRSSSSLSTLLPCNPMGPETMGKSLEGPSNEELIVQAGRRMGLLQLPRRPRHHHRYHSQEAPRLCGEEQERMTIFERKKAYFARLRRAEEATRRKAVHQQQQQQLQLQQQHNLGFSSYLDQRASTSYLTLPSAMMTHHQSMAMGSSTSGPRPATTGATTRRRAVSNQQSHGHVSSSLSILDPGSWASRGHRLEWHVISRHTPTVSLGR